MESSTNYLPLLFGAAVIVYHAYDRFKDASYETHAELERLHSLLSVDRMRTVSVVRLALVSYVTGLLIIYVLATAYVFLVPSNIGDLVASGASLTAALPQIVGGTAPGADPSSRDLGAIPIGVALVIVGLGTSLPYVKNIEIWLRGACHRLAGIPTKVLDHANALRSATFDSPGAGDGLPLLTQLDRDTIRQAGGAPEDELSRDLRLIAGVAEWVLRRGAIPGGPAIRRQFHPLEVALLDRKTKLFRQLRERNAPPSVAAGAAAPAPDDKPVPAALDSLATDADLLADDMCLLLALYREHGIIPLLPRAAPEQGIESSSAKARRLLIEFVDNGEQAHDFAADAARLALRALSWTLGIIVAICVIWAALPGVYELQINFPTNPLRYKLGIPARIWNFLSIGIFAFFVPAAIAIGIWHGATASGSWKAGLGDHWGDAIPRLLLMFLAGWLVGTLLMTGLNIWSGATRGSWAATGAQSLSQLYGMASNAAPTVLRGAFLGMLVVECLDRVWRCRPKAAGAKDGADQHDCRDARLSWALRAGAIMAAAGAATRALLILMTIHSGGDLVSRRQFDSFDWGLVVYAGAFSGLIGFFLILALSAVLPRCTARPASGQAEDTPPETGNHPDRQPVSNADTVQGRKAVGVAGLAVLSAILWLATPGQAQAERLAIGVRTDAAPYASYDAGSRAFVGYLVDLCTVMVRRAGFDYTYEKVTPEARSDFLSGQASRIDLLCDPTTITLKRTRDFLAEPNNGALSFSPIYHIANSGYLTRRRDPPDSVDDPEAPTAQPWVRLWLDDGGRKMAAPAQKEVWGAVTGTTSSDRIVREAATLPAEKRPTIDSAPDHPTAAKRLCDGDWQRYYGDEELIRAAVARIVPPCTATDAPPDQLQYEPYALVISTRNVCHLDDLLTSQMYAMAGDGTIRRMIEVNFPKMRKSASLEALLNIITVPGGAGPPFAEPQPLGGIDPPLRPPCVQPQRTVGTLQPG